MEITLKRFLMITIVGAIGGLIGSIYYSLNEIGFWLTVILWNIVVTNMIDHYHGGRYE